MQRLLNALKNSISGFKLAWRDEMAFKQEVVLAVILLPLAFFVAPDKISLVLLVASVLLVLLVELLNTGIEACIDRISAEIHPDAKKAKDTASSGVLIALAIMIFTWIIILV